MANQLTLIEQRIAQRARAPNSSAIRDILKLTDSPQMISFAGEIPSPAAFPRVAPREATARATHSLVICPIACAALIAARARVHTPALTMEIDI